MSLAIRAAGAIMAVIFVIDLAMGFLNQFAQRFNVFFLSMLIKSMATLLLLIVMLPFLMNLLIDEVQTQAAIIPDYLRSILYKVKSF